MDEKQFQKQRRYGADISRAEWMQSKVLTEVEKRCLTRGWRVWEKKLSKRFGKRKTYLSRRVKELQTKIKRNAEYILRLRSALLGEITKLLEVDVGEASPGNAGASPTDGSAGGGTRATGNAEAARRAKATPASDLEGAEPPKISDAQCIRLYRQAMATKDILEQERDRDLLQLGHFEDALRAMSDPTSNESRRTQKAVKERVRTHMKEAALIRLNFSVLLIAENIAISTELDFQPRTLLSWCRQFRDSGGFFKRDSRGVHEREWILSEEDLQLSVLKFLKFQRRVAVRRLHHYINNDLFAREDGKLRIASYGLTLPISTATCHSWMIKLGCKFEKVGQSYYTDSHEREVVKMDRTRYLRKRRALALRQPVWARVRWSSLSPTDQKRFEQVMEKGSEAEKAEVYKFESEGVEHLEFHVDFLGDEAKGMYDTVREKLGEEGGRYSVRFDKAAAAPCEHFHDAEVSKCNRQVYLIGRDESIYKTYAREGNEWEIRGVRGLRRKTEGPGEMVSARQDEQRGFGLVLTEKEPEKVNDFRKTKRRPPLKETPGTRFLVHGENMEGYWGYEQFENQVVDVMDVLETLYPGKQLVLEMDHSAGHAKYLPDGLHVSNMNVKYGGKQKELRDSIMIEGCLGPREAKMCYNVGKWSTEFVPNVMKRIVDLKPRLGEKQRMLFDPGFPPPFSACNAPEQDMKGQKST